MVKDFTFKKRFCCYGETGKEAAFEGVKQLYEGCLIVPVNFSLFSAKERNNQWIV
jgi:hypothetical protein